MKHSRKHINDAIEKILKTGYDVVSLYPDLSFVKGDWDVKHTLLVSRRELLNVERAEVVSAIGAFCENIPIELYKARPGQSGRGAFVRKCEDLIKRIEEFLG